MARQIKYSEPTAYFPKAIRDKMDGKKKPEKKQTTKKTTKK